MNHWEVPDEPARGRRGVLLVVALELCFAPLLLANCGCIHVGYLLGASAKCVSEMLVPDLQESAWTRLDVRYSVDEGAERDALVLLSRRWSTSDAKLLKGLQASLAVREARVYGGSGRASSTCNMLLRMANGRTWEMRFQHKYNMWLYVTTRGWTMGRSYRLTISSDFHNRLKSILEEVEGRAVYLTDLPRSFQNAWHNRWRSSRR